MNEENKQELENQETEDQSQEREQSSEDLMAEIEGMFAQDDPFQSSSDSSKASESFEEGEEEEEDETSEDEEESDSSEDEENEEEQETVAQLKKEIEELKAMLKEGKEENDSAEQRQEEKEEKRLFEITEEQFNELFENKDNFSEFMDKSHQLVRAEILKMLPNLVTSLVNNSMSNKEAINKFKQENEHIFNHGVKNTEDKNMRMRLIQSIASEIEAKNPKLSPDEVLSQTAKSVEKMLGIKKGKSKEDDEKKIEKRKEAKKAGFVKSVGANKQAAKKETTDLEKEMIAMLKA